ncbi:MAG: hypothetical protein CMH53_05560 [Myxococcales bacterium]|nr:hypothetical protein [Myxococcales bacterium]
MLDHLKSVAAQKVGKVLASDATLKVVGDPRVQKVMMRAINLRADAREVVEKQVKEVAAALDLVTREDVASLKRTIRDLEDTVEELRDELSETQEQAEQANQRAKAAETKSTPRKSKSKSTRADTATKSSRSKKSSAK